MRALGVGVAVALIVFLATAGHVLFLPFLVIPLGFFTLGRRTRGYRRRRFF
jgi:hypothetical protein